jgi:uncharacterized membrane protein
MSATRSRNRLAAMLIVASAAMPAAGQAQNQAAPAAEQAQNQAAPAAGQAQNQAAPAAVQAQNQAVPAAVQALNQAPVAADPPLGRYIVIVVLLIATSALFYYLFDWWRGIDRSSANYQVFKDAIFNSEFAYRRVSIDVKYKSGAYVQELLQTQSERAISGSGKIRCRPHRSNLETSRKDFVSRTSMNTRRTI